MKARIMASFMIWLAAVVSVAGIAWLAIGTAGKQVTADPIAAPLPSEFPPPSIVPVRTTRAAATRSPSAAASGPAARAGATGRATDRDTSGTRGPGASSAPSPSGSPRQDPRPRATTPVTSTYSTAGGRLRVRCDGGDITLDGGYAQPSPGYGVSVQSGGPDRIAVTFDSDKTAPLSVEAICGAGRPRFREQRGVRPLPTTTTDWRPGFSNQFVTPAPTSPPVTGSVGPTAGCSVPPSPTAPVEATPETTRGSTPETPGATPPATPTAGPTASPVATTPVATPSACPSTSSTSSTSPAATPSATVDPEGWNAYWSQREWAQRERD